MRYQHIEKWTYPDSYAGATWYDYYSAGVGRSRDSRPWEESNFETMLKRLGGESETVIVVRENHWAVGWVEWIAIHESNKAALDIAEENCKSLENYPILDEMDLSEKEQDEANEVWKNCYNWRERVEYIRDNDTQFEFHNFEDLLSCVRGEYFAGYASELID